jgi:hypothetical protein
MAKHVYLQVVISINGKTFPIKTVDYSESIREMINDGYIDNDTDIVDHLTEEYNDGNSGI